jgi:hypothetical protein
LGLFGKFGTENLAPLLVTTAQPVFSLCSQTGLPDGNQTKNQKIPFWVNFCGSCKRRCWSNLPRFWYILWLFGILFCYLLYFPILVCSTKINLATLLSKLSAFQDNKAHAGKFWKENQTAPFFLLYARPDAEKDIRTGNKKMNESFVSDE